MKRKVWGGILIALPPVLLFLVLVGYAVMNFAMQVLIASSGGNVLVGNVLNMILGFLGIVAVGGFFVFIPWGIYLLSTDGKKKE